MPVGFSQNDIDWHAFCIDEEVTFDARLTTIDWVRSIFSAMNGTYRRAVGSDMWKIESFQPLAIIVLNPY